MSEFKREPLAEGLECTGPVPDQANDQACPPRGVPPVDGPAQHGQPYDPVPPEWVRAATDPTGTPPCSVDKWAWDLGASCDEVVAVDFPGVTSREQATRQAQFDAPWSRHPADVLAEQCGSNTDPQELARLRLICDEQVGPDGTGTGMWAFSQALSRPLLTLAAGFCASIAETRPTNQDIGRRGSQYIDRWFLARKIQVPLRSEAPDFSDLPPFMASEIENLYLHRYHRGDADEPHDHPWPNASLVVSGWFREATYDTAGKLLGTEVWAAGDIVLRRATSIHAVVETSDNCLSLFATLRKERDWGYHTADGFVPWQEFRS